jgi:hypothetical protein
LCLAHILRAGGLRLWLIRHAHGCADRFTARETIGRSSPFSSFSSLSAVDGHR